MTRPGLTGPRVTRIALRTARLFALPILLVLVWWYASVTSQNYYLPTPGVIAGTFGDVWNAERLRTDALPSVVRLLAGFALAGVLGVALGVLIGSSPKLRAFSEPVLEFFRAIPPPVLVPVLILFAGIDSTMKIAVIVSGCIWPILLNTVEGVRAVDPVLADTCRSYGIGGTTRLRTLVLRSASPQIMAGLRQALSIAIILMVISEMFAASSGLGFTIVQFQRSFAIPEMWTGIVLLGLLGFTLAMAFGVVERRVLSWYHGLRRAARGNS
jgi:ABC-type nitrate/sulfonate/bicarbonate transport system permease component